MSWIHNHTHVGCHNFSIPKLQQQFLLNHHQSEVMGEHILLFYMDVINRPCPNSHACLAYLW